MTVKKPKPEEVETKPDGWDRFTKAVKRMAPPKPRKPRKGMNTPSTRKPKK